MSDDDLEVYVYQGNDGERVPSSAQHLIVKDGVLVVPNHLCDYYEGLRKVSLPIGLTRIGDNAFSYCFKLQEVLKIPRSVQVIGIYAFFLCDNLKNIEFEDRNGTVPNQLNTIGEGAFNSCQSLERVKLPSSVSLIGEVAPFSGCMGLIEADLSATCILQIPLGAFADCNSLQTVSLPKTLERICESAFANCQELVTVVIPLDSQSITLERGSFHCCKQLANIQLPEYSTSYENAFIECDMLQERYGKEGIFDGLLGRYDCLPVHRMCYDHSTVTAQELRRYVVDQEDESGDSLVDEFGTNPFHVFFTTIEPREELLDVLLDTLPTEMSTCKDLNNKRPLDYLVANWTHANAELFQMTIQNWMIDRVARWGHMPWKESMERKVPEILSEQDKEQRAALFNGFLSDFEHLTNLEATSILELALWKAKLRSGRYDDSSERQECRCSQDEGSLGKELDTTTLDISKFKQIGNYQGATKADAMKHEVKSYRKSMEEMRVAPNGEIAKLERARFKRLLPKMITDKGLPCVTNFIPTLDTLQVSKPPPYWRWPCGKQQSRLGIGVIAPSDRLLTEYTADVSVDPM